jgi:hypothetical protein
MLPGVSIAAVFLAGLSTALRGEPQTKAPDPEAAPVLAGPRVRAEAPAAATLVEVGLNGEVKRLLTTPEQAALEFLDLDQATRERIDKALAVRARKIDGFVGRNIDLLTKLGNAAGTGDKKDQLRLAAEAAWELRDVLGDGRLFDQVSRELPEAQRERFKALVDGYWDAVVAERSGGNKPGRLGRFGVLTDERLKAFGGEIERSFRRMVSSGDLFYQYVEGLVTLDEDQARVIREASARFAERGGDDASEETKREFFLSVLFVLTEPQREAVLKKFRGN